jgi:hypothetical protein
MKKLITLLFATALVSSLAMPVFAQETTGKEATPAAEKKAEKKAHKKAQKEAKKEAKEEAKEMKEHAPKQ